MKQRRRPWREQVFPDAIGCLFFLLVGGLFPASSQEGFHPDHQLGNGEGLFEVVIGPQDESCHDIIHGGLCSQE